MRNAYRWAAALPVGLLIWAAAGAGGNRPAQAAGIAWEKQGRFQTCLDAEAKTWLDAKSELVLNEDPATDDLDDSSVAEWAIGALKTCAGKAGGTDTAAEQQFMRYMAHWRAHLSQGADELRRKGGRR